MADPPLVVPIADVAQAAGLDEVEHQDVIRDAILDAQADVVAHLGRVITPTTFVETAREPDWSGGWNLTPLDHPVTEVTSAVASTYSDGTPTGYYTITYTAGLDARTDEVLHPIRRYIKAHALNSPAITRLWRDTPEGQGGIRSASTQGQTITYERATLGGGGAPGSGVPGALPTLASLDRWRVAGRRVYQRQSVPGQWPYSTPDWPV